MDASFNRALTGKRFLANMARYSKLSTLANSPRSDPFDADLQADLRRAAIVFLHVSVEDFLRSHLPKPRKSFTMCTAKDITWSLKRIGIDASMFYDVIPALVKLAERRNQIVHHADISPDQVSPQDWSIVDQWLMLHWMFAANLFYYQVRRETGRLGLVEQRALDNMQRALAQNVEMACHLARFGEATDDTRQSLLDYINEHGRRMIDTLHIQVGMFLDGNGRPLQGALSE